MITSRSSTDPRPIHMFTVHKAASLFLSRIAYDISKITGLKMFGPNLETDDPNYIPESLTTESGILCKHGVIVSPIRYPMEISLETNARRIVHIRDPRDALTSLYFSWIYSHPRSGEGFNPTQGDLSQWKAQGLETVVESQMDDFMARYAVYHQRFLCPGKAGLIKYEDLVTNFRQWLYDLDRSAELYMSDSVIDDLYIKFKDEFHVESENIYAHKRIVMPGDYKAKWSGSLISLFNKRFLSTILDYGYDV